MKSGLCCLALMVWALFDQAMASSFRVVKKTGSIEILPTGSIEWKKLGRKTIKHGTLVSVSPGASIELSHVVTSTRQKERIRIDKPMVIRLDDDLIRKFRYSDYDITRLFAGAQSELAPISQKPVLTLRDVMQRYMIRYLGKDLPEGRQVDPEKADVSTGKTLIPIEIYSPVEDSLFFLREGQVEFTVRWMPLSPETSYKVYSWSAAEARGEPLFETTETTANLRFQKAGSYRILIANQDGSARSSILQVRVLESKPTHEARRVFLKSKLQQEKMGLLAFLPAPQAHILTAKGQASLVSFGWKDPHSLGLDEHYVLHLKEESGRQYQVHSQELWIQTELPHGRYRWHITRENRLSGEVSRDSGAPWHLEVLALESKQLQNALQAALQQRDTSRHSILLDVAN